MRLARLLYPFVVGILTAGYYLVPPGRPGFVAALGLASVGAIAIGLRFLRPPRRAAWILIAVAVALLAVGDVAFTLIAKDTPGPVKYPALPDVFYLASYLPLAVGLLLLGRPKLPSRDWPMLLDTVGLSLAGSLVVWIVLVRPAVMSMQLTETGKVTAIASWVGYVAVLAASSRVVMAWRTNQALRLLGMGVLAFLLADFFYGRQLISGTWSTGSLIDLGFLAFTVLCGAAALTPSMNLVASAPHARHQLGPVRLTMVALALLVGPTALLVEATAGPVDTGVAIAIVSAAVGLVMVVRLSLSARAYQRRAAREQAVRFASRALVLATTETDVTTGLRAAFTDMNGGNNGNVRLVEIDPDEVPAPRCDLTTDESTGELVVPLASDTPEEPTTDAVVFTAPIDDLNELTPALYAISDQAASALQRIRLVGKLRFEERERYFRTLVMTSTDVTLITRNGRVTYATPSARNMFGRDVTGDFFDDLVHATPELDDDPPTWSETAYEEEGYVHRAGVTATVLMRRRDLTADPSVAGVVTTLRDVTAERGLQRDLAFRASHDPLTGLANAQLFGEELRAYEPADSDGNAVLFVDLDDFKAINDAHGHEVGDHLLAEVARRIDSCVEPDHVSARLGGDEFAVLLRDVRIDDARAVAQCIADSLARPAVVNTVVVDCGASVGLAYTPEAAPMTSLLREADIALYTAKAHGKGRWRQYRDGMPVPSRQHAEARRRLQEAIDSNQLKVFYQPIVELVSGRPIGFEALLRPDDPDAAGMSPEEFVAIAENTGMISTLGEWVLGRALVDAAALNPPGREPCYVSVNVSARQLRQADFVDVVRGRLAVTGIDPTLLVLEITENTLIGEDDDRAWRFLTELRRDGVRIAIDDYGTGFASLSYLRQTSIDIVKLDQSFLSDLTVRNRRLIGVVTDVFRSLDLMGIAEGVETAERRSALIEAGMTYGQGFYYGEAMPIDEAVSWLDRSR
jgi:diguanylate cyclase (GGDEF)-like protein